MVEYIILAVVAGLGQAVAHWFPWKKILKHDLPRIPSYIIGTLMMQLPFAIYLAISGQTPALIGLTVVIGASGLAVLLAYAVDLFIENEIITTVLRKYQNHDQDEQG